MSQTRPVQVDVVWYAYVRLHTGQNPLSVLVRSPS